MTRPQILYLTHRVPFPPNRGDRIRTYHILRCLSQWADVSLVGLADEPVTTETEQALRGLCRRVAIVPIKRRLRWVRAAASLLGGRSLTEGLFASSGVSRVVREWTRDVAFDAALASSSGMAPHLKDTARRGIAVFVDLIDIDSQKWLDYAAAARWPRRALFRQEGDRLRRWERQLAHWTAGTFVVTEAEAKLYRSFCAEANVVSLPNGVDTDYFRPAQVTENCECVFVGALDYPPNVDAACWFVREVWPGIRRLRPQAALTLVGREPVRAVRDLARVPGVNVAASVPDVRPYLARAAVAVVPLRIARGVQNKVLEALAMGKAVVTSPAPLAGLGVEPGVQLAVAESVPEWTERVVRLLDDSEARRQLGAAGEAYVLVNHRWERCLEPLRHVLVGRRQLESAESMSRV